MRTIKERNGNTMLGAWKCRLLSTTNPRMMFYEGQEGKRYDFSMPTGETLSFFDVSPFEHDHIRLSPGVLYESGDERGNGPLEPLYYGKPEGSVWHCTDGGVCEGNGDDSAHDEDTVPNACGCRHGDRNERDEAGSAEGGPAPSGAVHLCKTQNSEYIWCECVPLTIACGDLADIEERIARRSGFVSRLIYG